MRKILLFYSPFRFLKDTLWPLDLQKVLFRTLRKEVQAGAHGTLDYTIKEGVNKNKIADDKILKSKK